MKLSDEKITKAIVERYTKKFIDNLNQDVIIAGAGPAGLTAAYFLAKKGYRVSVYERKLSIGGGMWGGGMMFNEIVVGEDGKKILDELKKILHTKVSVKGKANKGKIVIQYSSEEELDRIFNIIMESIAGKLFRSKENNK